MRKFFLMFMLVSFLSVPAVASANEVSLPEVRSYIDSLDISSEANVLNNLDNNRYIIVLDGGVHRLYVSRGAGVDISGTGTYTLYFGGSGHFVCTLNPDTGLISGGNSSSSTNLNLMSSFSYYHPNTLNFNASVSRLGDHQLFFPPPPTPIQLLNLTTQAGLTGFQASFGMNSTALLPVGVAILSALLMLVLLVRWGRSLTH